MYKFTYTVKGMDFVGFAEAKNIFDAYRRILKAREVSKIDCNIKFNQLKKN